ncbi:SDR family NAD(P)-dependent oxidoreductase [Bacillus safensis]|uniref:SDR family NAD(P)-dependent oxidoreductase n=1 Tax=Bacillus safensis TaxID=561879 RepID=UPI0039E766E1
MKCAVITGSSSGIGKEISKKLAFQGFDLILVARNKVNLEKTKKELVEINKRINIILCIGDISSPNTLNNIEELVKTNFNKLDVLVNNAGAFDVNSIMSINESTIDTQININLKSPILLIQKLFFIYKNPKTLIY